MNFFGWLRYEILGNALSNWALGTGVFVAAWVVLLLIRSLLRSRLRALAAHRRVMALDMSELILRETKGWFLFLMAAFIGSRFWTIEPSTDAVIRKVAVTALLLQAGLWVAAAFVRVLEVKRQRGLQEHPDMVAAMDVLSFVARVAIWSAVLLVILDNLDVDITTLIAGLGVGGIAVALAAQNILGDLFASLSIVLDKPFVVGDFLIIGDFMGSVEKVGIKTTRVRSLSGEQLIFSNNDLLGSRIRNYGRMVERRVVFSLGVTYQTSSEQLERIPTVIREAVETQDDVRFDRAHFQKYGDFALIFEVVYHVLSADYGRYMDIQQAINLRIFERFEAAGIHFAYPTQTVYVNRPE